MLSVQRLIPRVLAVLPSRRKEEAPELSSWGPSAEACEPTLVDWAFRHLAHYWWHCRYFSDCGMMDCVLLCCTRLRAVSMVCKSLRTR